MNARAMLLWAMLVAPGTAPAAGEAPARLYSLTIETGLPHLEENLRYATTHATLCLGERQLASAFPILRHEALAGCRLARARREGPVLSYELVCRGGAGTTGTARWLVDAAQVRGTLDIKLGAKNMTFYQRVTGQVIGECRVAD